MTVEEAPAGGPLGRYVEGVRAALRPALCLHAFPSMAVERHSKPEVETRSAPEVLLPPVEVVKSEAERCLIEQSINATRVSFSFKAADPVEAHLTQTLLRLMMHRAEQLEIVRRVPVPGYALSLLVTSSHLERYPREALVDFICQFLADLYAEINGLKLHLAARNRAAVDRFWGMADARRQQRQQQEPRQRRQQQQRSEAAG